MHSSDNNNSIQELLTRFLEDGLDDRQREELLSWSRNNPDAFGIYCDFIKDYAIIRTLVKSQVQPEYGPSGDIQFDRALWAALARHEKTAPEIKVLKEKPQPELIQKVIYPQEKRKIKKGPFAWLGAVAGVVLMVAAFFHFAPERTMVAEVMKTMNAVWDNGRALQTGDYLYNTDKPLFLKSGLVEIRFEYGATAIIEAPCEFSGKSAGLLRLQSGRVYARVPGSATGFIVDTPASRVIDLGTEFGICINPAGTSDVHMFKGRASLIPGQKNQWGESRTLSQGQSRSVDMAGRVREIETLEGVFARSISSKTGIARIYTADISVVSLPARNTDATSDISTAKTYTHLLDFGSGPATVINGVEFTKVGHKDILDSTYEDTTNQFRLQRSGGFELSQTRTENTECAAMFADGGMRGLLTDYTYHSKNLAGSQYTLTLTGLKPGTHYSLRLYYCPYILDMTQRDVRENIVTFDCQGKKSSIKIDQSVAGTHYVKYDFLAAGTEVSVNFEALVKLQDWHLYGVTNEEVSDEEP